MLIPRDGGDSYLLGGTCVLGELHGPWLDGAGRLIAFQVKEVDETVAALAYAFHGAPVPASVKGSLSVTETSTTTAESGGGFVTKAYSISNDSYSATHSINVPAR